MHNYMHTYSMQTAYLPIITYMRIHIFYVHTEQLYTRASYLILVDSGLDSYLFDLLDFGIRVCLCVYAYTHLHIVICMCMTVYGCVKYKIESMRPYAFRERDRLR